MVITLPVMNAPASEASSTSGPSSSYTAGRGAPSARARSAASRHPAEKCVVDFRLKVARREGVDADVVSRQFQRRLVMRMTPAFEAE